MTNKLNKQGYRECPICHEALKEYSHKGTDIWQCTMCVFNGANIYTKKDIINFAQKLKEIEFGIKISGELREQCMYDHDHGDGSECVSHN